MARALCLPMLVLASLLFAGCGPNCNDYCDKLVTCGQIDPVESTQCVGSCENVGGDQTNLIDCVVDSTCPEIAAKACELPKP